MKPYLACALLTASLLPLSSHWLRAQDATASTTATPAPTISTSDEVAKRRQMQVSANQAISDGERFLSSGNYDQAAERFQFSLDSLTPGGVTAASYHRAEAGLAAAKAGQAQAFAKDFKFAEGATLLQQCVILQPDNPVYPADIEELKKQQIAYEEEVRDPEGTENNPAVTDDFKAKVAATQKLLFQGDAYFKTGQFDKSEATYSKILLLDPYNKAARDKMAHIERYRTRADGFRHQEYEAEAMEHVAGGWAEAISPDVVTGPAAALPQAHNSNRANITHKLESIIIDKVNFDKLDIATVVQYLQQKSKELDPDHEGINFVLRLAADTTPAPDATAPGAPPAGGATPDATAPAHTIHREVSITLTDVPLSDILGYVIAQTNLQYSVEDYAVYLRPSIDEGDTLSVRSYLVPPNFFPGSALKVTVSAPTDTTPTTIESVAVPVQQALVDKGIRFPADATATFLPGSSRLVVRDTPEQLDLIANLIEQQSQEAPQVQIEAKVAEFNQEAFKALSFNYLVGSSALTTPITSINPFMSFAATSSLRDSNNVGTGYGGLTPDGISNLIGQNGGAVTNPLGGGTAINTANTLSIGAVIDNTGLMAVISAINNLTGASLLSAPSITTQSGLKASIDIVREFPYPSSFDKPKLSNSSNLAYSGGINNGAPLVLAIPPTPREFVTQDVGISLEVEPTTYSADQRIDLDISKAEDLEFDGFINYGVPILTRTEENTPPSTQPGIVITPGTINQPVFDLRSMVTTLQVLDGQTAVLGGLTREDTQVIDDKVPILGDLPLFGRLFQSKVSDRTKKDLIFFITARLIRSNGKPEYIKSLDEEPVEEALPEPDQQIESGNNLPAMPEGTPNS